MSRSRRALAAIASSLLTASLLQALPARAAIYVYSCILNPRQEVPPVAASGLGAGRFVIDTDANTVTYRITFAGLTSAEQLAHIHGSAAPGVNAGVLVSLPLGNPKVGVWNYTEPQQATILGGLTYANIHTTNNGGGELRGQIVPLNALMDAGQETPVNGSTGKGWCVATVDTALNQISYYVQYESMTGPINNGHFHGNALYGTPAGVKIGIGTGASPIVGTAAYSPADEAALLSGQWYVNLHTVANPGGEIRGQLVPCVIPIDAAQEVLPSVVEPASSGFAMVAVDTVLNALSFDERVLALSSAETLAHIHGYADPSGTAGVVFTEALGARKIATWTYGGVNRVNVLAGRTYFNVHSSNHGGGEIRGQIMNLPGSGAVLGVEGPPRSLSGFAAAPNPFGARTQFTFHLSRTGSVAMRIVGVDGRSVRRLPEATFAAGPHTLDWDGRDDAGKPTAPGIYFAVIHTPDGEQVTRVARLR